MNRSFRNDKNPTKSISVEYMEANDENEREKDKKIKRLTQINKQLIETLKQQNDELTKKIQKQKLKVNTRSNSVKGSPTSSKQLQSVRKELSNAHKQIDMYKQVIQNLKARQISVENVQKINQLENKVKNQDNIIQSYQKELKLLQSIREKQEKDLKVVENQDVKESIKAIETQTAQLKEKLKTLKKNSAKRQQIEKRQHAYHIQLEKALRKANDQYYSGKVQKKDVKQAQADTEITEREWQTVKTKLFQLRKLHQQNGKKVDNLTRQKNKQLKSYQQNQLKLKEKLRKLNNLKCKITELSKLVSIKQHKESSAKIQGYLQDGRDGEMTNSKTVIELNDKNKGEREVKKWNVPQGYCLEKGKILPDSYFFSDKNLLGAKNKYKIIEVSVWMDGSGIPSLLKFVYQNQSGQRLQGGDMIQNPPPGLEVSVFKVNKKDYLSQTKGKFVNGYLSSITFRSKLGKQMKFSDDGDDQGGDEFNFFSKPNQIPSCFFGATIRKSSSQVRICHLGCQFITDW